MALLALIQDGSAKNAFNRGMHCVKSPQANVAKLSYIFPPKMQTTVVVVSTLDLD